jgi:DNA repair protein RecN (Recombination protein N)
MLTHLQLRDFVIVDHAELELGGGMTALTGETGAGKSIVVDALLLIAGGRADSNVVRQGAERAEVSASFGALPPGTRAWFEAQSMEYDPDLVIRRVIGADGRSRAYVNGQVTPLQALRELADQLIDIHGQQEFQRLVARAAQREMLDERIGDLSLTTAVRDAYERHKAAHAEYEALVAALANRDARLDLLRYQVRELKADVTSAADIEALFVDQKRIAGRGRLATAARTALDAAYDSDAGSAHDALGHAQTALRPVTEGDPQLSAAAALLGEAAINLQEAAAMLRHYLEQLDIDPARQEEIERRAAALESLARKHRLGVLELPAQLQKLEQELAALDDAQLSLGTLEERIAVLAREYHAAAKLLHLARAQAAAQLGRQVTELMQALGMAGGVFQVAVTGSDGFGVHGGDEIEFLVSANPGQPPRSLAKVASGGELSRISLAIQVAAAGATAATCMVFDEVDAGIGGGVAEIVGRQLRALGGRSQVLCVTHLPQVAAQAHAQYRVSKLSDGKITRTAVKPLSTAERTDEIARMLGGVEITGQARAHAAEMLALAAAGDVPRKKRPRASQR